MKNKQLFMHTDRCTGCQLCVMACSLMQSGGCGENGGFIKVLSHPLFDTFLPVIDFDCLKTDCNGECVEVCSPRILKLADEQLIIKLLLHEKWQPVLILPFQKKEI